MITKEKLEETYKARRAEALRYTTMLPEDRVSMNVFIEGETRDDRTSHKQAVGVANTPCGTVACLAGWLVTMPSFKLWLRDREPVRGSKIGNIDIMDMLIYYLGISEIDGLREYFALLRAEESIRIRHNVTTHKAIAYERMEKMQNAPYTLHVSMEIGYVPIDNNKVTNLSKEITR